MILPLISEIAPKAVDGATNTVVGILCIAIVALWRFMLKEFAECKKDREILRKMITDRLPTTCSVKNCAERVTLKDPFPKTEEDPVS